MTNASGSTIQKIHPTAIIHPSAQIAENVEIGPFAVIGEDVVLHPNVRVGPHAILEFCDIGAGAQIHASAFVGTAPQDLKYCGERTRLTLGAGSVVRECVTLNRGASATGITRIGERCLFMAYSHVAHDCIIGAEVILANSVALAGHVEVGDGAVLGGMSAVHQFVRIGKLAMLGGGTMLPSDVPPFMLVWGNRARLSGLNVVGLKRKGYAAESVAALKRTYHDLFESDGLFSEQVAKLSQAATDPLVKDVLTFIAKSNRGICRPSSKKNPAEGN